MLWAIPNVAGRFTVWLYGRLRTGRYVLPMSQKRVSGWKDYDRAILEKGLVLRDRVYYLRKRLDLTFFNSLDCVYVKTAPRHYAVNGPDMSFFLLGTSMICCCIEALGAFVTGATSTNRIQNKAKFKAFMTAYMPQWQANGTDVPDWMYENLRNSLAHGFWIKDGGMEDLGKQRLRLVPPQGILVHAELLYSDLKEAVERYFAELESGTNAGLVTNFENRFKNIYETF